MDANYQKKWIGLFILIMLISVASNVVPVTFGEKITISPFLIFVIIIVCNVWNSFIFQREIEKKSSDVLFGKIFFINLIVSLLFSFLLIGIYKIVFFIGQD